MIITNFNEFQEDCELLDWDEYETQKEIERRLDEDYDEQDFKSKIDGVTLEFIIVEQSRWRTTAGEKSYTELNDDDWEGCPEEIRDARYVYSGYRL